MERAKLPTHSDINSLVLNRNLAMNWLIDQFPKAFDLRNRRPLKNDILNDILSRHLDGCPDEASLQAALSYYMRWGSYLMSLELGARCIDLDGIAVGFVTKDVFDDAQHQLQNASLKHTS